MSDASIITIRLLGDTGAFQILSFMTRNDWWVDSMRRWRKLSPDNKALRVLGVQEWQAEDTQEHAPSYSVVERRQQWSGAALLGLIESLEAALAWAGQHPDLLARAIDGPHGKAAYITEAWQARQVRADPQRESVGGEDGEGYEFMFDVLETLLTLARRAAGAGHQLEYLSSRSADWD